MVEEGDEGCLNVPANPVGSSPRPSLATSSTDAGPHEPRPTETLKGMRPRQTYRPTGSSHKKDVRDARSL